MVLCLFPDINVLPTHSRWKNLLLPIYYVPKILKRVSSLISHIPLDLFSGPSKRCSPWHSVRAGSRWWSETRGTMIKASRWAKRHPVRSYSLIMHFGEGKQQSLFKSNNSKQKIRDHLDSAEAGWLFNAHVFDGFVTSADKQTMGREDLGGRWWHVVKVYGQLKPVLLWLHRPVFFKYKLWSRFCRILDFQHEHINQSLQDLFGFFEYRCSPKWKQQGLKLFFSWGKVSLRHLKHFDLSTTWDI